MESDADISQTQPNIRDNETVPTEHMCPAPLRIPYSKA